MTSKQESDFMRTVNGGYLVVLALVAFHKYTLPLHKARGKAASRRRTLISPTNDNQ